MAVLLLKSEALFCLEAVNLSTDAPKGKRTKTFFCRRLLLRQVCLLAFLDMFLQLTNVLLLYLTLKRHFFWWS